MKRRGFLGALLAPVAATAVAQLPAAPAAATHLMVNGERMRLPNDGRLLIGTTTDDDAGKMLVSDGKGEVEMIHYRTYTDSVNSYPTPLMRKIMRGETADL